MVTAVTLSRTITRILNSLAYAACLIACWMVVVDLMTTGLWPGTTTLYRLLMVTGLLTAGPPLRLCCPHHTPPACSGVNLLPSLWGKAPLYRGPASSSYLHISQRPRRHSWGIPRPEASSAPAAKVGPIREVCVISLVTPCILPIARLFGFPPPTPNPPQRRPQDASGVMTASLAHTLTPMISPPTPDKEIPGCGNSPGIGLATPVYGGYR